MWNSRPLPDDVAAAINSGQSRILAYRKHEGVSAVVLAEATDITAERLLQLEDGDVPTDEELQDIAAALGVSTKDLIGD